jgi:Flp pilus assembly protein TadG
MDDRGSATLETALVVPVLVLLTVALCGVISAMATQIRCIDAARSGARAAARGESEDAVRAVVRDAAPHGTQMTIARSAGYVQVLVTAPAGGLPLLENFTVHAEAEAADESTYDDNPPDPSP